MEDSFEIGCGISFDPSKLDYDNPDREKMRKPVLNVLKKVVNLSNANTIKNADGVMAKKPIMQGNFLLDIALERSLEFLRLFL